VIGGRIAAFVRPPITDHRPPATEATMTLTVLDPTPGPAAKATRLAPPLDTLAGRTVGLLDNG